MKYKYTYHLLILFFFLIGAITFYIYSNSQDRLSDQDFINNSPKYIEDIQKRLIDLPTSISLSKDEISSKISFIDGMYNDGLINASKELYYLPSKDCGRDICLSIREQYILNFNFPFYE